MTKWFEDIDDESVATASAFPLQIQLPDIDGDALIVKLTGEPELVEGTEREMIVCQAERLAPDPPIVNGSIILGKSLRFNMASALKRAGENYKKFKLSGSSWRIWAIKKDEQKYYKCERL